MSSECVRVIADHGVCVCVLLSQVYKCLVCSRTSFTEPGASRAPRQQLGLELKSATDSASTPAARSKSLSLASSGEKPGGGKAKFSFLATLDKKMASGSSRVAAGRAPGPGPGQKKESDGFMAFSASSLSGSNPKRTLASSSSSSSSSPGALNLLELEASNKKKKRKSVGGGGGGPPSLGSLQQMLQKR
jgi:hypothetical protein